MQNINSFYSIRSAKKKRNKYTQNEQIIWKMKIKIFSFGLASLLPQFYFSILHIFFVCVHNFQLILPQKKNHFSYLYFYLFCIHTLRVFAIICQFTIQKSSVFASCCCFFVQHFVCHRFSLFCTVISATCITSHSFLFRFASIQEEQKKQAKLNRFPWFWMPWFACQTNEFNNRSLSISISSSPHSYKKNRINTNKKIINIFKVYERYNKSGKKIMSASMPYVYT